MPSSAPTTTRPNRSPGKGKKSGSADSKYYGGGPDQTRYSPLTQISPRNVKDLRVAWTYDTHDAFDGSEMQCQPVVADGVLYATSPKLRVFALNAASAALSPAFATSSSNGCSGATPAASMPSESMPS